MILEDQNTLAEDDTEYWHVICQNLAAETDRMIEDLKSVKDLTLIEWSRIYWQRVGKIIDQRRRLNGKYDPYKFRDLEVLCIEEYKAGNARNLVKAKKQLKAGDEEFVTSIERIDEIFRRSIAGIGDISHRREHVKTRNQRRERMLRDWRIRKREILDYYYELEAKSDKLILADVDSLSYQDFCPGGRSTLSKCFS